MRIFLLMLLGLAAFRAQADVNLYVDSSKASSGNGTSWATAYKTLNEALNVANNATGTVQYNVLVAKGTYYPPGVQSSTNQDTAFVLGRTNLNVIGGFQTGGSATPDPVANPTILSGNIGDPAEELDNTYHVVAVAGIYSTSDTTVLRGFIITGGNNTDGGGYGDYNTVSLDGGSGAGISCRYALNRVHIRDCNITGNKVYQNGGGLYMENCGPLFLTAVVFSGCEAERGGAAMVDSAIITGTSFLNNTAVQEGGGLYLKRAGKDSRLTGCAFQGNTSLEAEGGGMYTASPFGSSAQVLRIRNTAFTANAARYGGGLYYNGTPGSDTFALLYGCTFTGNAALADVNDSQSGSGGGAYILLPYGVRIDSNLFYDNNAAFRGGGMYCIPNSSSTSTSLRRCRFDKDSAAQGGGLYAQSFDRVDSCVFLRNHAWKGGGLYNYGSLNVSKCTFRGNTAAYRGGGMFDYAGSGEQIRSNCLFSGNAAGFAGGGVADTGFRAADYYSCTFAGNSAPGGNGIHSIINSSLTAYVRSCIVWDGAGTSIVCTGTAQFFVWNGLVEGGYASGNPILTADPEFVSPLPASAAPDTGGNYTLTPCSPAIDTGAYNPIYVGPRDLAGNPRVFNGTIDMGAYEYPALFPPAIGGASTPTVCLNATLALTNAFPGGSWTSSDEAVATVSPSGVVTGTGTGTAVITYTATTGTCTDTASKTLTVVDLSATITQSGSNLVASPSGMTSYQWLKCFNYTLIPGATNPTYYPGSNANGFYAVVINNNGCLDTSDCFNVVSTGIDGQPATAAIQVYPNPATTSVRVNTGAATAALIEVRDLSGKLLSRHRPASPVTTVPLNGLATGAYFLMVYDQQQQPARYMLTVQ